MLHLILKAYKTSIVLHLSQHQQGAESLVPWGRLLFTVVNLQVPKEAVPEDDEGRERSEWWKAKKWAYYILGRLFHRYVRLHLCISIYGPRGICQFRKSVTTSKCPEE